MRQEIGVLVHMENVARHVPLGGPRHERLAPETEQCLGSITLAAVSENERNILIEAVPVWLSHLGSAGTRGNSWLHNRLPQILLAFIENALDRGHHGILYRRAQQYVEQRLGLVHRQADVEPDGISLHMPGELLAHRADRA